MKRGYFAWDVADDDNIGLAVVASSVNEAKKIVYDSSVTIYAIPSNT